MHHRPHLGNGYRLSAASITTAANTDATTCPSAAVSALLLLLLLLATTVGRRMGDGQTVAHENCKASTLRSLF